MKKYYCIKCGMELISKKIFDHHDLETGEKEYLLEWRCPKHNFWNQHTKLITDSMVYTF